MMNLFDAIKENDVEQAEHSIELGANVNGLDEYGIPALHRAVAQDNLNLVGALLKANADVNIKSEQTAEYAPVGQTPLHIAAGRGNIEMFQLLLNHGADLEAKDRYGLTPLMSSIDLALLPVDVIRFLIKQGADVNAKMSNGETVLDILHCSEDNKRVKEQVRRLLTEAGAK